MPPNSSRPTCRSVSAARDQEAWDIATYMDSQERPQDPRFVDSVAETRKRFHDEPTSKYGLVVNGVLLGEKSPPSGTINAAD
jgi:thiosulfate dehydrogenase